MQQLDKKVLLWTITVMFVVDKVAKNKHDIGGADR